MLMILDETTWTNLISLLILAMILVILGLGAYFLFHLGNERLPQERRLKFGPKQRYLLIFIILGIFCLLWVGRNGRQLLAILVPFILGGVIAYAVDPMVDRLTKWGLPRIWSVVVVFFAFLFLLVGFTVLFVPMIINQVTKLIDFIPVFNREILPQLSQWYEQHLGGKGYMPDKLEGLMGNLNLGVNQLSKGLLSSLNNLLNSLTSITNGLLSALTTTVVAFYCMLDEEKIQSFARRAVPAPSRHWVYPLAHRMDDVLGGFIRGQLVASLIAGILSTLALVLLKVDYWLILGILAGLFNIIPYFGPVFGAAPAVLVAFVQTPMLALWVLLAFIVIQQVMGSVIAPRIMGNSLGLHPIVIIFTVIAGGALWGFTGLLISIPLVGVVKVLLEAVFGWFRINYPQLFKER